MSLPNYIFSVTVHISDEKHDRHLRSCMFKRPQNPQKIVHSDNGFSILQEA